MLDQTYIDQQITKLTLRLPQWCVYPDGTLCLKARLREFPYLNFTCWLDGYSNCHLIFGAVDDDSAKPGATPYLSCKLQKEGNLLTLPIMLAKELAALGCIERARVVLKSLELT